MGSYQITIMSISHMKWRRQQYRFMCNSSIARASAVRCESFRDCLFASTGCRLAISCTFSTVVELVRSNSSDTDFSRRYLLRREIYSLYRPPIALLQVKHLTGNSIVLSCLPRNVNAFDYIILRICYLFNPSEFFNC